MNNKVDKLFKDKLESHQVAPSATAWDKLEHQLAKKNKAFVWLRAAAVLALFSLATVVAIDWPSAKQNELDVAKKETSTQPETPKQNEQPATIAPTEQPEQQRATIEKKKVVTPRRDVPTHEEKPVTTENEQPLDIQDDAPELIAELTPVIEQSPVTEQAVQPEVSKPVVIVYTLPAIPRKDTAPVEEKKTGFQRVLEVANNVKNADNPFGELREAKNDLFALEFRRDKDKNKNNN